MPTWHTLATLKALRKPAQVDLAGELSKEQKGITETSAAFKARAVARWSDDILSMLGEAEVHWRSKSRLVALDFPTTGGVVARFERWASSFFSRLRVPRVAALIKAAKEAEGPSARKPKADGLNLKGTTPADRKKRQSMAIAALSRVIQAAPSRYRALTALKRCGSAEALDAALSDDPERKYLAMLSKASILDNDVGEETESDDDDAPGCRRVGCKSPATSACTIAATDAGEELPLCAECHALMIKKLAGKNKRKKPGHPRWPHMAAHWISQNPLAVGVGCWSCDKMATAVNIAENLHWCNGCVAKSLKQLADASDFECAAWTDDHAEDYLETVKERLKVTTTGDKKKQDTENKRSKKRARPVDLSGDSDAGEDGEAPKTDTNDECVLCGVACGEDRCGRLSGVTPERGVPVLHRKCKAKLCYWWRHDPVCVASVKTLRLKGTEQWAHAIARAKLVRNGKADLAVSPSGGEFELADTLEGMGGLATAGGVKGDAMFAIAKMLRGNESGAKASAEDRREFGLDKFPWDLRDAAVEAAKRRGGRFMAKNVADREMEREEFLWWLAEGTSMDAASTEAGRELVELARASGASRRYREGCIYALLEGLARLVLSLDEKALSKMDGAGDLYRLARDAKACARYAQQRIQWIAEERFTWDEVETSETMRLEQSVLNKHKTGKVLSRAKLQTLMKIQREDYLDKLAKSRKGGGGRTANMTTKVKEYKSLITSLQTKLKKRPGGLFAGDSRSSKRGKGGKGSRGGTEKPFCKWCKRAGRQHLIYHHDSSECNKKPPNG